MAVREEGRKEVKMCKKESVSMPRFWASFSIKCSEMGKRKGNNESRTPFQDSCFVLIVQAEERRKKPNLFSSSQSKKRTNLAFSSNVLEQCCTNPVIMHIFRKQVKAVRK